MSVKRFYILACIFFCLAFGLLNSAEKAKKQAFQDDVSIKETALGIQADISAVNISNTRSNSSEPKVTGFNGNAYVVWAEEGGMKLLYLNTNEGGKWAGAKIASLNQRVAPSGPWLNSVIDSTGRTHYAFAGSADSGNYEIYYNSYQSGNFSGVVNVSRTDGGYSWGGSNYPSIGIGPNLFRYVIWYDDKFQPDIWYLFMRYKDPNASDWSGEIVMDITPSVYEPEIRVDARGTAHIIFLRRGYGSSVLYYMSSNNPTDKNSWTQYYAISDQTGVDFCGPNMDVDNQGNVYVTWEQEVDGRGEVYYRKKQDGQWGPIENISKTGTESRFPAVAAEKNSGGAALVWLEKPGSTWQVLAKYYAGGKWSSVYNLGNTNISNGNVDDLKYYVKPHPSVAVDNTGKPHVVYVGQVNGQNDIFYVGEGGSPLPVVYPPTAVSVQSKIDVSSLKKINTLTWEPNPLNEGQSIAHYRIYRKQLEQGEASYAAVATVAGTVHQFVESNLTSRQVYNYVLTSVTEAGQESGFSSPVADQEVFPPTYPPAGASIASHFDSSTGRKINALTWQKNPKNGDLPLKNYVIYRKESKQTDPAMTRIAKVSASAFRYEDRNLSTALKYVYAVSTLPDWDIESERTAQLREDWIFPPSELSVETIVHNLLFFDEKINVIKWGKNRLNDATTVSFYNLFRKKASDPDAAYRVIAQLKEGITAHIDRNVPLGQNFSYVLTAVDSSGNESRRSVTMTDRSR